MRLATVSTLPITELHKASTSHVWSHSETACNTVPMPPIGPTTSMPSGLTSSTWQSGIATETQSNANLLDNVIPVQGTYNQNASDTSYVTTRNDASPEPGLTPFLKSFFQQCSISLIDDSHVASPQASLPKDFWTNTDFQNMALPRELTEDIDCW